jgi:hypothetical protein
MRGALLHKPAGLREMPILRVVLKTNLAREEAIATIAHELQHTVRRELWQARRRVPRHEHERDDEQCDEGRRQQPV